MFSFYFDKEFVSNGMSFVEHLQETNYFTVEPINSIENKQPL